MNNPWQEQLQKTLSKHVGAKESDQLCAKYGSAFSTSYSEECDTDIAYTDIVAMEKLSAEHPLEIFFYLAADNSLHLRLFQFDQAIPLSDVLPMLENLDLRTLDERPYKITLAGAVIWIGDFTVTYTKNTKLDIEKIKTIFKDAFIHTRLGLAENDGFNKLIIGAHLSWREVAILRAYAKYLRQAGFRFSQTYIEQALASNAGITRDLIDLFKTKFDPNLKKDLSALEALQTKILQALESVTSLDEDRIIRRLLALINATLRSNYFQTQPDGSSKEYISFKFKSQDVPELPLPLPLFEIFVYSPRFEGIHLRSAKVARGGIRWSDRREDFRTEILGLMKAQKVKNAVIVPSGAKGGFVLKALPAQSSRDVIQKEVVSCYKSFIRGLLDLTDNLKDGKVFHPSQIVFYDEPDTYLVVAADKGTATFSDIANGLSKEYDFWLGDAFASGGSAGYDHKKMGITARGAWESVKRHFHELDLNPENTDFTVIGVGDMSGDVFGNGLIYSPHIKLIAAFDHRHIFLDPNPDAQRSYQERVRLFNLPTSSWEDYDAQLISAGGGVFKRTSKSITLSPEIKQALDIKEDTLVPTELIRAILKAPVDLFWNGGIGTYVKASTETHADVGDKTNEFCRINGNELRCRVVGEGGNLGFTQFGRVEYALQGGLINTDFIDNSAGVDCSDHEVNIKILLNNEVSKGKISEEKRNILLTEMTQAVAELVLADNSNQALVMSFANFYAKSQIGIYQNYIRDLESAGILNRQVEFLPDDKKLAERKAAGLGLTRPELAVLLAYTKIYIKSEILKSDIPENAYFKQILETAFPAALREHYQVQMAKHSLYREIVATQLSNQIVNEMGITFVYNLQWETGASVAEVLRAYDVASQVFGVPELQRLIDSLDFKVSMATQYELLSYIRHLLTLSTRWFLRHKSLQNDNMPTIIQRFATCVKMLEEIIPNLMGGSTKNFLTTLTEQFINAGISKEIAQRIAVTRAMYTSLNIIEVSMQHNFDLEKTAQLYFAVGEHFNLLWFRDRIANDAREGYWDSLARLALRDELDVLQKKLTVVIIQNNSKSMDAHNIIEQWLTEHPRVSQRWETTLAMLNSSTSIDYVMFFIALRELADLIRENIASSM